MGLEQEIYALTIGLRELVDIILIICILFLIILILKVIEKELALRLSLKKKDRNTFYKKELSELPEIQDPEKALKKINSIARGFFNEAFGMSYSLEYLELAEELRKIGNKEGISFCRIISEVNYSGERVDENKIKILIGMLSKIVEKNKIPSPEEKNRAQKKKA